MAMRTAVCTAIGFFLFTCLRIAGKYDLIVSIYGIIFKESKNKINLFICPDDGMHHILQGAVPSFFFRLIALVQPGDRLIHPFFRKGKDGAFFFLIRGLLLRFSLLSGRTASCRRRLQFYFLQACSILIQGDQPQLLTAAGIIPIIL